jgi:tetratricopeptide (TPR) repeat protein
MINQKIVVLLACSWALAISSVTGHGSTALAQQKPPATSSRTTPDFAALSDAAEKARQEGRNDDAIRLYRQGLSVQPDWKQGLWFLGMLLYEKEQYAEVRDLMRRFVAVEPLAGPGWALLGLSEFQTREYPRSLEHLQHVRAIGLGKQQEMSEALFYHVSVLLTRFEQYDAAMTLLMGLRKSGSSPDLLVEPIGLSALRCIR